MDTVNKNGAIAWDAYRTIKHRVVDLHLRPGEVLTVQTLAKDMSMSRTPVREALVRLSQEGLVEPCDGRKFRVVEISLKQILDIYDIREDLECLAINGILRSDAIDETINELQTFWEQSRKSLAEGDFDAFFADDLGFHLVLIRRYGNKIMLHFFNSLTDHIQRIRYLTLPMNNRLECTVDEHAEILDALKRRDAEAACTALRKHLSRVSACFKTLWEKSQGKTHPSAMIGQKMLLEQFKREQS